MGSSSAQVVSRKRSKHTSTSSTSSKREAHQNRMNLESILNSQETRSTSRQKKRFRKQHSNAPITGQSPSEMDKPGRMDIGFLLNEEDNSASERPRESSSKSRSNRGRRREELRPSNSVEDNSGSKSSKQNKVMLFRCPCSAIFASSEELVRHRKETHNNKSMFCPYCNSVYSRYDSVRNHVEEKHKKPGELWCHKCSYITQSRHSFDQHMAVEHHVCKKCGKVYTRHLREHIQACRSTPRE